MSERRIFHARQLTAPSDHRNHKLPAMPPHPRDDGAARPKWNSKWDFDRDGKRVRVVVVAYGPEGEEETIDAREFIERLGEDHRGTSFTIHVETEQIWQPIEEG
jgi:hypothetical protein